jgi:hypothetical protein
VVVNAPAEADALTHHGLFLRLIETNAIRLVPTGADIPEVATAVLEAAKTPVTPLDAEAEIAALWETICAGIDG